MSLMDFADGLTPEDMAQWNEAVMAEAEPDAPEGEKKRKRR